MATLQFPSRISSVPQQFSEPATFREVIDQHFLGADIVHEAFMHLRMADVEARELLHIAAEQSRKTAKAMLSSLPKKPAPWKACEVCGDLSVHESKRLCQDCTTDAAWQLLASVGPAKNQVIINGDLYTIHDEPKHGTPRKYLGHDGRQFRIERGGQVIVTRNLWLTSSVPWRYRTVLPDNARFVLEGGAE